MDVQALQHGINSSHACDALSGCGQVSLQLPEPGSDRDLVACIQEAVAAVHEAGLPAPVFDFSTHDWSY
jgi:hypothetical protein